MSKTVGNKKRYKKGHLPGSQYNIASNAPSTYSGTMQKAAQKKMKDPRLGDGGGYSSYEILNQIESIK